MLSKKKNPKVTLFLIIISGTPATGKSRLAKLLEGKLRFERLDIENYYKEISAGYDRKKQCYKIDLEKFEKLVMKKNKEISKNPDIKGLVIDSHIAHLLPRRLVDFCVVLVCSDLKLLEKRLKKRRYSKKKIMENLDAEIFQVCLLEAKEKGHKVVVVDVGEVVMREVANKIAAQCLAQ